MALAMVLILAGMGRMFLAECDREKIITAYSGKMETMKLTAVGFSDGSSVEAYFTDEGRKYRVLLRFKEGENIVPGDIIEGEVTLNQPLGSKIKFPG